MAPFRALYYPSWNPPVKWLRSVLLFYDQVQVILPSEIAHPTFHPANSEVFNLLPSAFGTIRKAHYEMALDTASYPLFLSALDHIASSLPEDRHRTVRITLENDIHTFPGYTFLHLSKLSDHVIHALESRRLLLSGAEDLLGDHRPDGFRLVEERTAHLLLSLIADYYSRQQGLRTISDQGLSYLTTALHPNATHDPASAVTRLASTVIRLEIPTSIQNLTPLEYVELRKRYASLRAPFQRAMRILCDDRMLASITTQQHFKEAVPDAAKDFGLGIERIRKGKWAERLGSWGPLSFGMVSSLCSLASPVTAAVGAGVDICLKIFDAFKPGAAYKSDIETAQKVMADLRTYLLRPSLVRRLLNKRS